MCVCVCVCGRGAERLGREGGANSPRQPLIGSADARPSHNAGPAGGAHGAAKRGRKCRHCKLMNIYTDVHQIIKSCLLREIGAVI